MIDTEPLPGAEDRDAWADLGGQAPELLPEPAPAGRCPCDGGWLGTEDHPRPCPRCKPHLRRTAGRSGVIAWRPTPKAGP